MKNDYVNNGQPKLEYNVQISSESQFIIHYILYQTTNDIHTLKPHLVDFEQQYESLPENLSADAGYGSEENYEYLEQTRVEAYLKYNAFDNKQQNYKSKRKTKNNFHRDTSHYNVKEEYYVYPIGQRMKKIYNKNEQQNQVTRKSLAYIKLKTVRVVH